jgi:hypothetical protein
MLICRRFVHPHSGKLEIENSMTNEVNWQTIPTLEWIFGPELLGLPPGFGLF